MINFRNQVPMVYTDASRDFQYLGWLINIVLNSVKHNVDTLYELPYAGSDSRMAELFALTLGFKLKRNYNQEQLAAIATILPLILKYKGTLKAVEMIIESLKAAAGADGNIDIQVDNGQLVVRVPKDSTLDTTLFFDLLDYILPAGMTYRLVRESREEYRLKDTIKHSDALHYEIYEDLAWKKNNLTTGLSGLFDVGIDNIDVTANFRKSDNAWTLNAGLLSNTVIPVLADAMTVSNTDTIELLSTEKLDEETGNIITKTLYSKDSKKLSARASTQEF